MAVAQNIHCDAGQKVDIFFPVGIIHIRAFAVRQNHLISVEHRHEILLVEVNHLLFLHDVHRLSFITAVPA